MEPLPGLDDCSAMVRAHADEDSASARLRAAIALGRDLTTTGDALIERFVAEARAAGLSWTEIGTLFGTSKQAAQKRYVDAVSEPGAWGRWTPAAYRALNHASERARALGHGYVGTEHALLGLLEARDGVAAQALVDVGITREIVQADDCLAMCQRPPAQECLNVMPRFKQALELAGRLAERRGVTLADTEHLLAGIVAVPHALAVEILNRHGVTPEDVRGALADRLRIDAEQLSIALPRRRRLLARSR